MKIVLRVKNKINRRALANNNANRRRIARMKWRGDILCVVPDDHSFSLRERKNPHWRILRIPALTEVEAVALEDSEDNPDGSKEYVWERRKRFRINHPGLPQYIRDYLTDDTRTQAGIRVEDADLPAVLAAVVDKGRALDLDPTDSDDNW